MSTSAYNGVSCPVYSGHGPVIAYCLALLWHHPHTHTNAHAPSRCATNTQQLGVICFNNELCYKIWVVVSDFMTLNF